jgi:hypothetical protein
MIRDKVPLQRIEKALREAGIRVSKTSIGRHRKNHMNLDPETPPPTIDTLLEEIEKTPGIEKLDERLGESPEHIEFDKYREIASNSDLLETAVIERRTSQLMLEKIVQNQLSIVSTMQEKFIRGVGEYPRDPITGLKSVMDLIVKLPAYNDGTINHQNMRVDEEAQFKKQVAEWRSLFAGFYGAVKKYAPGSYLKIFHKFPVKPDEKFLPGSSKKDFSREAYETVYGETLPKSDNARLEIETGVYCGWEFAEGNVSEIVEILAKCKQGSFTDRRYRAKEMIEEKWPDEP